jgi:DNA-binding transcriptional ArsR family regulator
LRANTQTEPRRRSKSSSLTLRATSTARAKMSLTAAELLERKKAVRNLRQEGLTISVIARHLGISDKTVSRHLRAMGLSEPRIPSDRRAAAALKNIESAQRAWKAKPRVDKRAGPRKPADWERIDRWCALSIEQERRKFWAEARANPWQQVGLNCPVGGEL